MLLDDDDRLRRHALALLVAPLSDDDRLVASVGARWTFVEWGDGVRIHHVARRTMRPVLARSAVRVGYRHRTELVPHPGPPIGWRGA